MAKTDIIKSYVTILDRCRETRGPSFPELQQALSAFTDKPPAERTIRRYLSQLRQELGIEIRYQSSSKSYRFFPEDSVTDVKAVVHFLNLAITADTLRHAFTAQKDAAPYIHADRPDRLQGISYLKPLLEAIHLKRKVHMVHQSFWKDEPEDYEIDPYFMREYEGRWYCVARKADGEFRFFGIDRIHTLEVADKTFRRKKNVSADRFFTDIIGVSIPEGLETETVKVAVHPDQAKYFRTLPLHESQQLLAETWPAGAESMPWPIFSYRLIPNFELQQRILMQGASVRVLEPPMLALQIHEELKKAVDNY